MSHAAEPPPGRERELDDILARVDRLANLRAAWDDPLAWYVEALHFGDVKTVAMAAIRSEEQ